MDQHRSLNIKAHHLRSKKRRCAGGRYHHNRRSHGGIVPNMPAGVHRTRHADTEPPSMDLLWVFRHTVGPEKKHSGSAPRLTRNQRVLGVEYDRGWMGSHGKLY